jgi:hypothetical protein
VSMNKIELHKNNSMTIFITIKNQWYFLRAKGLSIFKYMTMYYLILCLSRCVDVIPKYFF